MEKQHLELNYIDTVFGIAVSIISNGDEEHKLDLRIDDQDTLNQVLEDVCSILKGAGVQNVTSCGTHAEPKVCITPLGTQNEFYTAFSFLLLQYRSRFINMMNTHYVQDYINAATGGSEAKGNETAEGAS
jgi:hypothetical protein